MRMPHLQRADDNAQSVLLSEKQAKFNAAMDRYERVPFYSWTGRVVSLVNVGGQGLLFGLIWRSSPGWPTHLVAFFLAYVIADFVNGWVHLHMDNGETYDSFVGPFYAAFHLHHRRPRYRQRPILTVYFQESGSKVWLALVELAVLLGVTLGVIRGGLAYFALYFSALSCVAEVSHYLCHVPGTRLSQRLGEFRILLSRRRHARHHCEDNVQYAFLNGMSDPLLDWIASRFYAGYKSTTDHHYAAYFGSETRNRT